MAGLLTVLALVLVSCDSDHSQHTGGDSGDSEKPVANESGSVPGEPAEASDADRRLEIAASDELRFDPVTIEATQGEAITFTVHNEGKTVHEFVLGDAAYQEKHEEDMAHGGHEMADLENAVSLEPGESGELTWRFKDSGEVLYACHEPGHYEGGMVGTIVVE